MIRQKIEAFKKANWNYNRLDMAISWKGSSADTLLENVKSNHLYVWLSAAKKIGSWGQLLVAQRAIPRYAVRFQFCGLCLACEALRRRQQVESVWRSEICLRRFLEKSRILLGLGSEFNPLDGIWLELYAGWQKPQGLPSAFVSNFTLKCTVPERFKLF